MRRRWTCAALAVASILWCGPPSRALADDVQACITPGDGLIDGCTRVILSKTFSGKGLAWAYNNRGTAWSQKAEFDKAIADFSEAVRLDPSNVSAYANRGSAWSRKGELDKAISDFSEVIRLNPTNGGGYSDRGFAWAAKGGYEKATADLDEAIKLDPKQARAWSIRGDAWDNLREYDKAIADFGEAIKLDPRREKDYVKRCYVWTKKGELDKSIADCTAAIALDPKNLYPHLIRGDVYRYAGKLELALNDFNDALVISPDNIPALTRRGLTYERMQQIDHAREEYQKALRAPLPQADIFNQALRTAQAEEAIKTARARLAALDSGVAPPTIPSPPASAIKRTAIPTPEVQPARPAAKPAPGRRVALVIGNSAYRNVPSLANPEKDARAIAETLRNLGFAVVTLELNVTREKMITALRDFSKDAQTSDWAMIYYAGHGMEVGGVNYLIPVDAKIVVDRDIQNEAVPLSQLLNSAEAARKIKLIMLDACRDNPFKPRKTPAPGAAPASTAGGSIKTRSTSGHGLAEVRVAGATLVVYAAKDGQVAMDGEGGNSPFAVAVVQRIATPGVEINKVFRLVRDDVMEATAGRQEPYTYGSLPGKEDFFFVEKP